MKDLGISTTDVPGYFLQTDIEGTARVRIAGVLSEILLNIDPEKYGS